MHERARTARWLHVRSKCATGVALSYAHGCVLTGTVLAHRGVHVRPTLKAGTECGDVVTGRRGAQDTRACLGADSDALVLVPAGDVCSSAAPVDHRAGRGESALI